MRRTLTLALLLLPALALAEAARPAQATIVPDRFLRRWDPVTVFFTQDVGPAQPGPEDHPERLVTLSPAHPGQYRWLDAHTLQFRPAEPWPSLQRFSWKAGARSVSLATLMEAPVESVPANGAEGLDPVSEIALGFAQPLDVAALSRMVSIELRPLPGVGTGSGRFLTPADFQVKTAERRQRSDRATYVLALREPIPVGVQTVVHLRLSLDDDPATSFREIGFRTAEPFRATALGCRDRQYPVTPGGTRYAKEQAIACSSGDRVVLVEFSATPQALGPVEGRNLVRFTPAVPDLTYSQSGRTLEVRGKFAWDTLYTVALSPTALTDAKGRPLEMAARSELSLHFPRRPAFVKWTAADGVLERLGAQMVPVEGRGEERLDLRIFKIPALDRSFWPFPERPVVIDESQRPPGPGEEPAAHTAPERHVTMPELMRQLGLLGSPPVSALVDLPLRKEGSSASFGLDLAPHLAKVWGAGQPGTYLVGLRDVAAGSQRAYMRVQVTDLSLSTLEEPHQVRFVVTSLSSGQPVAGARVRVEATHYRRGAPPAWETIADGTTDAAGSFTWPAPGRRADESFAVRRIVVDKGEDVLVLDPMRPPDRYADNQWSANRELWLQWAVGDLEGRGAQPETLAHIFTERPVYRPGEEVHIKGYLRQRAAGRLSIVPLSGFVVVEGPNDLAWRYPVTLTAAGSFYRKFQEQDIPTGSYRAHLEDANKVSYGEVKFQIEAYRIPTFEVALSGPDTARLDEPFQVGLVATYYAGGRVGGQKVQWRVTQFPHAWAPKRLPGFHYASDARFSRSGRFQSTPRLDREDTTAEDGSASLQLDPGIEPTAEPRAYVVEATVTGPDDQTVTATRTVPALPPFVLGLKVPRFLERAKAIEGELLVAGSDGELIDGQAVTVRLLRREWHSTLRASDFAGGAARYQTDVVDVKVSEEQVKSGAAPLKLSLPIDRSGVWVVELESHDRLDRAQVLSVDLYAGGDQPVAWPKPATPIFSVATDKPRYDPGGTANLVLKSPFQNASVLAVVEAPEGNRYSWLPVANGAATFKLPVEGTFAPRVPVHFVLMRGRLPGSAGGPASGSDLGKPATMAATAWVDVNPLANQVKVALANPETARPGQKIEVEIKLADPAGKPLPGEVTLWLVDQAVLALGREQRLDPLPDFITRVRSYLAAHDTRNGVFGMLPFAEAPGGDGGDDEDGLLDRATVRKNFKSVPFFDPAIQVGPDGVVKVTVQLPDDLTNFKLRAKAASGPDRFGYATGQVSVRLPVIVQPALPRFVRPGDAFTAAAIGRVVEGEGGAGSAEVRAEGVKLEGPSKREIAWLKGKPERIEVPVSVSTPPYDAEGKLAYANVTFRMGVARASDGATDAFEVKLPVRDDRERMVRRVVQDLVPGMPLLVPALPEAARPGTVRRQVLVSSQPALVRMAAGLDFLRSYPYGCAEQQTSRARAYVAFRKFRELLGQAGGEKDVERAVKDTLAFLPTTVDANGLIAYWPGSPGSVSLTAWVVQFLVEAKAGGFAVDEKLQARLVRSLQQALRSDYSNFVDGEAFAERAWALIALAQAGEFDAAYAAELTRKAEYLDLESVAQVVQAFATQKPEPAASGQLASKLWEGLVVRLYQGKETYGGLQDRRAARSGLILPSETRTVAEVARALARQDPKNPRFQLLIDALVTLGKDDGWGTTNANSSALLALGEVLKPETATGAARSVSVKVDGKVQTLTLGPGAPLASFVSSSAGPIEVLLPAGSAAVVARVESAYVPAAEGSQAAARSTGFVVSRELLTFAAEDVPPEKLALDQPGRSAAYRVGDVIEDHVQVVNPKERHYVAVVVPLAAGLEPLNPKLATAPPEARPKGAITRPPTYVAYLDDSVAFYYNTLPAGTYDFSFRTRATTAGRFIQPSAKAEMMYDGAVVGTSPGAVVTVEK